MKNIIFQEHNFKTVISKTTKRGEKFPGQRNGKPFLYNNELLINLDDSLHFVDEVAFYDKNNNEVSLSEVPLDTGNRMAAVIVRDNKLLLQHRIKQDREYYVFPGGHQTTQETEAETIVREVLEELGLQILGKPQKIYEYSYKDVMTEKFFLIENIEDFSLLLPSNPETKPGEINEPIFLSFKEAMEVDLFPKEIIEILADK